MTQYTVVKGDNLWDLSRRFKTTIDIILSDNSIITDRNKIQIGWVLKMRTPGEVAAEKASNAQAAATAGQSAAAAASAANPPSLTVDAYGKQTWDGVEVLAGQTGRIRLINPLPLVERLPDGTFKELRWLSPPTMFRTFEHLTGRWETIVDKTGSTIITSLYSVGKNQWIYDLPGLSIFEPLPTNLTVTAPPPPTGVSIDSLGVKTAYLEPNNYKRPVIQVKKDNTIVTMELRVLGTNMGYANQIQANQTNGGWLINLGGSTLPTMAISGYFLDTKTNKEFDDFISRYRSFVTSYRDGDFYSSAICTFYYKGREYKGLIAAFNYSDQSDEPLLRRFSLQFLVLKEKGAESGPINTPTVAGSQSIDDDFRGDIRYLLMNPITGLYGSD